MENIFIRYCEKAEERDNMESLIMFQTTQEKSLIADKSDTLKKVRAIKTAKENERNAKNSEFERILAQEKKVLKDLENSKLEIESAKKNYFKEELDKALQRNNSFGRLQKTYGDKAIKKIIDKETEEIKKNLEKEKIETKKVFEDLYEAREKWQKIEESLNKDITETLKPKILLLKSEIFQLEFERNKIEKEILTLQAAEEEASSEINNLANLKRNELVHEAKKVSRNHGGEISGKIDQLYEIRDKKESEIAELEAEMIKLECELTEKELATDLEILKTKAKIKNLGVDYTNLQKTLKTSKKSEKNRKIDASEFIEDLETVSKSDVDLYSLSKKSKESPHFLESKILCLSPFEIKESKTEEIKDIQEESNEVSSNHKENLVLINNFEENFSDVSSEIPCPKEIRYKYDQSDLKNKVFFDSVLPLIEGTVMYKKFKTRNAQSFDPLEASIYSPDACGYGIRKMKITKQLSKIEIRNVGKAGVESSIMIDKIISVVIPAITNEIIKAKNKNTLFENSMEKAEEYDKAYRVMKTAGNVNFNSEAFVFKAKETNFFPFYLCLKNGRVELMAEGFSVYKSWVEGITLLIKNKNDLERLKFKIISY